MACDEDADELKAERWLTGFGVLTERRALSLQITACGLMTQNIPIGDSLG